MTGRSARRCSSLATIMTEQRMKPMHTPNETARNTQTAVVKWLSLPSVTAPFKALWPPTVSRARPNGAWDAAGRLVSRHASGDYSGNSAGAFLINTTTRFWNIQGCPGNMFERSEFRSRTPAQALWPDTEMGELR
jgi:hypothetical protein